MKRKALIFDSWFEAPDNLIDYIVSLGYNKRNYKNNFDLMFDERVIDFVKNNLKTFRGNNRFQGKESYNFKIGFAGCVSIVEVDTTRPWIVEYGNDDGVKIKYIKIEKNEYGYVTIKKTN